MVTSFNNFKMHVHGLKACFFKYITVGAFRVYAEVVKVPLKGMLEAVHLIVMEITLLIMENQRKIMKLCF